MAETAGVVPGDEIVTIDISMASQAVRLGLERERDGKRLE